MISAIIFDCDGVLIDSEVLAHEVETAMLAEAGLVYDRGEFTARFMGMSDAAFYAALDIDSRERLGRPLPEGFQRACHARLYREVETRLAEVPGAARAVMGVTLPKAVASSSRTFELRIKLGKTGLWPHFDPHVYSADHVTHAKPAPDLFLHAANALGAAPSECLVIEDSVNGVRAGLAAGMRVWGFGGGGHMTPQLVSRLGAAGAERIVADWSEAGRLFEAL